MKTLEQILTYKSQTIDGRDLSRLSAFIPESQLEQLGVSLKDEFIGKHVHKPFTRENVLEQLRRDVAFGFEKALDKRGISAGCMYQVVSMWNWILEEGLEGFDDYAQYGLPLFKATAIKYGFPDEISGCTGKESQFESD